MSTYAQIVIIAWIPFIFYLFNRFSVKNALVISFIGAWLFLPQKAGFVLSGLPDYERMSATIYGILLSIIIWDSKSIAKFEWCWIDIPMFVWCICPLLSSITNNLGVYDGFSAILDRTAAYGGPYCIGRLYFNSLDALGKLAVGIFIGGLIYVPLCLYEIRFSPQLHKIVYGYHGNPAFHQTIRYGGYRPVVFMQHGLSVGFWMTSAALIGIWLWKANVITRICSIDMKLLVVLLVVTTVAIKSTGAIILLVLGVTIVFVAYQFRTSIPFVIVIFAIFFYLQQNVSANSHLSEKIISTLNSVVSAERVQSLQFRFDNEELLKNKARERIIFGWGGWNRNRVYDYDWKGELVNISTVDSLWIIAFGVNGIVGLASLTSSVLIPPLCFCWFSFPVSLWSSRKVAPAAILTLVTVLYTIDSLFNGQYNPVFTLATGGISGLIVKSPPKIKEV